MMEKANNFWYPRGTSLVGTMTSITILCIAIVGTANFRCYATRDSRKAFMFNRATRIAVTLSEGWRAVKGSETYNPIANLGSDLTITQSSEPEVEYDESFTLLASYKIVLNGTSYHTILAWKDVSTGLRAINVIVAWAQRGGQQSSPDNVFKLTTYALTTD